MDCKQEALFREQYIVFQEISTQLIFIGETNVYNKLTPTPQVVWKNYLYLYSFESLNTSLSMHIHHAIQNMVYLLSKKKKNMVYQYDKAIQTKYR